MIPPTVLTAATGAVGIVASVLFYDEFELPPSDRALIYQQIWAPAVAVIAIVAMIRRTSTASMPLAALGLVGLAITVAIVINGSAFGGHAAVGWTCTATYALAALHLAARRT